jgi:hypothetical protein
VRHLVQFRIVRARTLTGLRADAADVALLRGAAAGLRREDAGAARREAGRAGARLEALTEKSGRRLGSLIKAARAPAAGPRIQGQIALQVVRDIIAEARASGDPGECASVRIMDALLGEDWPDGGAR